MRVIIHSCDSRLWYVREFLAPALRDQGLRVSVHNDDNHRGNLWSYIDSFRGLRGDDNGTWHVEDDVFPCRDFAKIAHEHNHGIVYGFHHEYGERVDPGWVPVNKAGYSFPCMRIPNRLAAEFADWFMIEAQHRDEFQFWIKENKYIDSFWDNFLRERHPEERIFILDPSIVEHVDEFIGGSVCNEWRDGWCKAKHFRDSDVIESLKVKLASR